MQHRIIITGIESKATKTGNTKMILLTEKGKYHFFQNQKGGQSPAFVQFQKFGFKIGDTVDLDSQDEEKSFVNPKGDTINYTEHWIQKFGEIDGIPLVTEANQGQNLPPRNAPIGKADGYATSVEFDAVIARIDKMAEWASMIEKRLSGLETLEQAKNPEAVEFHQSFPEKKFDFGKAKEILTDPSNSGVKIEMPENL